MVAEHSDTEIWVSAAKNGDRSALAKLLAVCDPQLRVRAEARMDRAIRARRGPDDILQDTYLEATRQIDRFQGRDMGSFLKWVSVILDHKLVDAHRAAHCQARDIKREVPAGVRPEASSYWNLLDLLYAESGTPSRVVRRQEALSAVLTCISNLSESHREVIRLRFLEGLAVADVARRLGKSEKAIVALSKRALEALRGAMDELGEFTRGQ